jgi:hypothetical protein
VPITVAPAQRASCAASEPTPPRTPCTRTLAPVTGPSPEHPPVRGDPGDPEAGTELVADAVRQVHRRVGRDDGVLRRRARRPVGLGAPHPHPLADPRGVEGVRSSPTCSTSAAGPCRSIPGCAHPATVPRQRPARASSGQPGQAAREDAVGRRRAFPRGRGRRAQLAMLSRKRSTAMARRPWRRPLWPRVRPHVSRRPHPGRVLVASDLQSASIVRSVMATRPRPTTTVTDGRSSPISR